MKHCLMGIFGILACALFSSSIAQAAVPDCSQQIGPSEIEKRVLSCPHVEDFVAGGNWSQAEVWVNDRQDRNLRLSCALVLAKAYAEHNRPAKATEWAKTASKLGAIQQELKNLILFSSLLYNASPSPSEDLGSLKKGDETLYAKAWCGLQKRVSTELTAYVKAPWDKPCPAPAPLAGVLQLEPLATEAKTVCERVANVSANSAPASLAEVTQRLGSLVQLQAKGIETGPRKNKLLSWQAYYQAFAQGKSGTLEERLEHVTDAIKALENGGLTDLVPQDAHRQKTSLEAVVPMFQALDGDAVPDKKDRDSWQKAMEQFDIPHKAAAQTALGLLDLYESCEKVNALISNDPCLTFLNAQDWNNRPYGILVQQLHSKVQKDLRTRAQTEFDRLSKALNAGEIPDWGQFMSGLEVLATYASLFQGNKWDELTALRNQATAVKTALDQLATGDMNASEAQRQQLSLALQDAWKMRDTIMCQAAIARMKEPTANDTLTAFLERYRKLPASDNTYCLGHGDEYKRIIANGVQHQFEAAMTRAYEAFNELKIDDALKILDEAKELPLAGPQARYRNAKGAMLQYIQDGFYSDLDKYKDKLYDPLEKIALFQNEQEIIARYQENSKASCDAFGSKIKSATDVKLKAKFYETWGECRALQGRYQDAGENYALSGKHDKDRIDGLFPKLNDLIQNHGMDATALAAKTKEPWIKTLFSNSTGGTIPSTQTNGSASVGTVDQHLPVVEQPPAPLPGGANLVKSPEQKMDAKGLEQKIDADYPYFAIAGYVLENEEPNTTDIRGLWYNRRGGDFDEAGIKALVDAIKKLKSTNLLKEADTVPDVMQAFVVQADRSPQSDQPRSERRVSVKSEARFVYCYFLMKKYSDAGMTKKVSEFAGMQACRSENAQFTSDMKSLISHYRDFGARYNKEFSHQE